jgi:pimeloyl-ACP methyl ester carboxylesterase
MGAAGTDREMTVPMPELPGVRHAAHDLPTGVQMHVAEAGDPAAPALLAVHGWPQHWWMWRGVIPELSRTHRVISPDLRGFGWSGQPADGSFVKERLADDVLALLDRLGIERAGYLGHDWGGWTGWLLGIRAPERFTRMMLVSIIHPWTSRLTALTNGWRLVYQPVLGAPLLGPAIVREGHAVRRALESAMPAAEADAFARVVQEPERALASSLLYRSFELRELPALAAGRLAHARIDLPVKLLFPRGDRMQSPAQLEEVERHVPRAEVEVVDGGHWLPDERPQLVADRARAWFA